MFKAEKSALAAALAIVKPAINSRNTIPVLANVLLERDGADLVMTGTNFDLQLSTRCAANFEDGFTPFTVPHALMTTAVKTMTDGSITIGQATPEGRFDAVALKSGRARIKIPILPARDFPKLKPGQITHTIGLGSQHLRRCIEAVSFAVSTEETRIYLNGIFLEATPQGLMFVATDGHRMARRLLPSDNMDEPVDELPHVIMPTNAITAMLNSLPDDESVSLGFSEERIELSASSITLISKLVDGTFPDYKRIIPSSNETIVRIGSKALSSALDRVLSVNTEKGSAVVFAFQGDTLTLKSKPGDHGEAEDAVAIDSNADLSIGFNGRYMQDIIRAIGADDVEIALSTAGSAAIIRKPGEPVSLSLLMPMRIGAAA